MNTVETLDGTSPLILSMPHCGTGLPPAVAARLNETGRALADTDWWIDRLYGFAGEMDASVVKANLSRYVIDLNRDPSGQSLYPGQATTGLCPTETFEGEPLYSDGQEPTDAEIEARRQAVFAPYHDALSHAIARAKQRHGIALLYDCHSIRSVVPRLFDGTLPTVNIGTHSGRSCAPDFERTLLAVCAAQDDFSFVANGRFKGGWITRHYGDPHNGVHAIQIELAQSAYMEEAPPWTYDEGKARRLQHLLRAMLTALLETGLALAGEPR